MPGDGGSDSQASKASRTPVVECEPNMNEPWKEDIVGVRKGREEGRYHRGALAGVSSGFVRGR